ncbi:Gfo/Idh/MocA family protein [Auraticoccus monumenti]|uniref:Predicted dehydrogenase n=1 Tax=Auraticoccus monumenti TaxID=675864 RepID=A0A1G6SZP1_9ACTN|nr:Gfo/Idh/MocA family oxidoreductase [Auraticoccus monumenti]SDD21565.1 Predicted dehydrogenase [Auraticoccus monumenti]
MSGPARAGRVLRAAVVGAGAVSRLHVRALEASPHARLVAVTDQQRERAEALVDGCTPDPDGSLPRVHDDLATLLATEQVDVVHICTPPGPHREQTEAAVAAGAHVVCEKPPALSLDDLEAMTDAARRAGRELAVVFQQRTGSAVEHVRGLLTSGRLGRPLVALCHTLWYRDADYFAEPWRGRWATEGGGTTLSHSVHQIDLMVHLLGDWASVRADLWRLDREVETEDVSTATVRFAGGTVASLVASVLSPRQTSSLRIDTEHATVTLDHLYGHGHDHWRITPAAHVTTEEAAGWALPAAERPSSHDDLVASVYASLAGGRPLPDVVTAPARALEIVTAIYASAELGSEVTPEQLRTDPHRAGLKSTVRDLRTVPAR